MGIEKDIISEIDFGDLVENSSVVNYIKASPLESGERSKLDKVLTEDYFYNNFYAHSDKAEARIKQLKKQIYRDDIDVLILSGNRGCGKSTFIRYFLRQAEVPSIMINFEDNWEPDVGIKKNIVMALNNRIYNDLFIHEEGKSCKVICKYLELFGRNENSFLLGQIDIDNYFSYFADKLEFIRWLKEKEEDNRPIMKYYEEDIRRHTIDGTIKQVMMLLIFWDIAEKIEQNSESRCLIVFENLDAIYNTEDVADIVKNLFSLKRELARIDFIHYHDKLININQNYILVLVVREDTKSEIARAVSGHEYFNYDRFRIKNVEITGLYHQNSIIEKRVWCIEQYLIGHPQYRGSYNFMQVYNAVKLIGEILSDSYLNLRLSELFDYDYRASSEVLSNMVLNDEAFILACRKMLAFDKEEQNWSVFGFQSIVFRKVFNLFTQKQYFANVQRFEYVTDRMGIICKINLDRMILLYLNNSTINEGIVPLNILFDELMKFCQIGDTIVDALWQLYDMRRKYQWNNLITFVDLRNITYDELTKQMKAFVYQESFFRFAGVRITKAGETYLNQILPHFEYYAARCREGKGKSPFAMTVEEICDGREFDQLLKDELEEISDCCQKLYLFFNNVFDTIEEFRGQNYLMTGFATSVRFAPDDKVYRMFYCERNIYANISYLDNLRFYIFAILDDVLREGGFNKQVDIRKTISILPKIERNVYKVWYREILSDKRCCCLKQKNLQSKENAKVQIVLSENREVELPLKNVIIILKACLNVRLIEAICSFMGMFGHNGKKKRTMYSKDTPRICNALDACINKIRNAGYIDFTTKIDLHTGENILEEQQS